MAVQSVSCCNHDLDPATRGRRIDEGLPLALFAPSAMILILLPRSDVFSSNLAFGSQMSFTNLVRKLSSAAPGHGLPVLSIVLLGNFLEQSQGSDPTPSAEPER
jgi:hypothetical protein